RKMVGKDKGQHERVAPPVDTAFLTSNAAVKIVDISSGGFSSQCLEMELPLSELSTVDISLGDFSLVDIPVQVAWENKTSSQEKDSIIMSTVGFKFGDLTPQQRAMIDFFIYQNTAGNA
ncbi:MAG: PilZ domain-containing protein, partial [Magnetococcales bacterium]|nr:PilZ domain-containing protein [Magnetococcales bacterium]